ncbi:uncharacterized protein LOC110987999 [Acanthaster planci]|uniref:Uncharacterized protein LOC110987999 n=1 Tax=Acanthaster planci TaxID=133434 RepID=A0A8B7ZTV3_ACAPL|nr:uncharacterized protein LOC110987999 [Acanthaster planci]
MVKKDFLQYLLAIETSCDETSLALFHKKKLLKCHIYAVTLNHKIIFPALTLVVSGGHTQLGYLAKNLDFKVIGHTVDDAVGEVIDKIARKIGLAYPGGAELEKLAKRGENKYMMKVYENKKDLNFSFSGLKTHAMKLIQQTKKILY